MSRDLQDKPTGVLNVDWFFGPMMEQLDRIVTEGFVCQEHRDGIYFDDQPSMPVRGLSGFESPDVRKWIDRGLTRLVRHLHLGPHVLTIFAKPSKRSRP